MEAGGLTDGLRQSLQHNEKTAGIILEVEADGSAHKAGIVIGDILVSLAGQPISRPENVQPHLQAENIGKSLGAKIVRGAAVRDVSIAGGGGPNGGAWLVPALVWVDSRAALALERPDS